MGQDIVERIFIPDIRTTVQHGASWHLLVQVPWFLSWINLIHHHFHDWVAPGWTFLTVYKTSVRSSKSQRIRPVWRITERSHHAAVIQESLIGQCRHLSVSSHLEERSSAAVDLMTRNVCPSWQHVSHSSHLICPRLLSSILPIFLLVVSDGVSRNLVASSM